MQIIRFISLEAAMTTKEKALTHEVMNIAERYFLPVCIGYIILLGLFFAINILLKS